MDNLYILAGNKKFEKKIINHLEMPDNEGYSIGVSQYHLLKVSKRSKLGKKLIPILKSEFKKIK